MPPEKYFTLLQQELAAGASFVLQSPHRYKLNTVYFGGGTPSLVPANLIVAVLESLTRTGFALDRDTEITLEINPATVDPAKMDVYQKAGINRFSVGAQTFSDPLLRSVRREHTAAQTRETLRLLQERAVNYTFDLLFALPGQTVAQFEEDLSEVARFLPPHISPYCLTVPEGHVLSAGRPPEPEQVQMFEILHRALSSLGYRRYEISNYALPGYESRHNQLYWTDQEYWGLGLSSHSYFQDEAWGVRFWNASAIGSYADQISSWRGLETPWRRLPEAQVEILRRHQSLTDFCHTSLRQKAGLQPPVLTKKFGGEIWSRVEPILNQQVQSGLLETLPTGGYSLTDAGVLLSNQVFGALTFLASEVPDRHP